ncbi:MAG: amidohydrolase family protein [Acidobacteriota bacterium]
MKPIRIMAIVVLVAAGVVLSGHFLASPAPQPSDPQEAADLAALAGVHPIDTHTHVFQNSPAYYRMLKQLNMRTVDICVVSRAKEPPDRTQRAQFHMAMLVHRGSGGRVAVCTTFDPYPFRDRNFDRNTINVVNENFREGAIAVKIWKNIGMDLKGPSGKYVEPDNPVFEPIYKDIAAHNKTLIAHLAEPDTCWEPLASISPANPDYVYYKEHPRWHMYGKPDAPVKAEILAARDHLLAENPHLRVVGAHLGSMETSVDEIARRFDRYPNFAVDTAARIRYLMAQPRAKVRAFLIKYQDRVCYGTDGDIGPGADAAERIKSWEYQYAMSWKYFATDETFEYQGLEVRGLDLPRSVVRKIYHENAVHWFPGVAPKASQ